MPTYSTNLRLIFVNPALDGLTLAPCLRYNRGASLFEAARCPECRPDKHTANSRSVLSRFLLTRDPPASLNPCRAVAATHETSIDPSSPAASAARLDVADRTPP